MYFSTNNLKKISSLYDTDNYLQNEKKIILIRWKLIQYTHLKNGKISMKNFVAIILLR